MQGFLTKKKDKTEKWKQQYFVLKQEGQDSHMYIYEHPKRTKPKGLIDLSCAYLYAAHESLFDKRNVFQLVERALPCLATTTYLSADTASGISSRGSAKRFLTFSNQSFRSFFLIKEPKQISQMATI
jgi:PH domain